MADLVSYVICALNEEQHVGALLDSIHEQRHRPIEVLVVDGGSRDRTRAIVEEKARAHAAPDYEVRLLREEDHGALRSPGNARNLGVAHARGEKLLLFDADLALVDPDFTGAVAQALDARETTSVRVRYFQDTPLELYQAPRQPTFAAVAFRRSVFDRARFDPRLGYGEDEHLWRAAGLDIHHVAEATVGRHVPHTWGEQYAQSRWYGRTLLPFLRRMKADFPESWPDVRRRHFLDQAPHAAFYAGAPILVLALAWPLPWLALGLAALYAALFARAYLREPRAARGSAWHLRMFVTLRLVSSAGFLAGLLRGAWNELRGRARLGRDER